MRRIARHPEPAVRADLDAVIAELKASHGVKSLGAMGYTRATSRLCMEARFRFHLLGMQHTGICGNPRPDQKIWTIVVREL